MPGIRRTGLHWFPLQLSSRLRSNEYANVPGGAESQLSGDQPVDPHCQSANDSPVTAIRPFNDTSHAGSFDGSSVEKVMERVVVPWSADEVPPEHPDRTEKDTARKNKSGFRESMFHPSCIEAALSRCKIENIVQCPPSLAYPRGMGVKNVVTRGMVMLLGALLACGPGNEDPRVGVDSGGGASEFDGRREVVSVDANQGIDVGLPVDVEGPPSPDGSAEDTPAIVSPNVDGSTSVDGSISTGADGSAPAPVQPNDEGCVVFRDAPDFRSIRQVQTNDEGLWVFGTRADKEVWVSRNDVWQKDAFASGLEGPWFINGTTIVMSERTSTSSVNPLRAA